VARDSPALRFSCGDPFRVAVLACLWDSAAELAFTREFRTMQGAVWGTAVVACSHGIGSSSAEIAVVELAAMLTQARGRRDRHCPP
jgi:uridine phosphorylase